MSMAAGKSSSWMSRKAWRNSASGRGDISDLGLVTAVHPVTKIQTVKVHPRHTAARMKNWGLFMNTAWLLYAVADNRKELATGIVFQSKQHNSFG
jgi:hypothetical protein